MAFKKIIEKVNFHLNKNDQVLFFLIDEDSLHMYFAINALIAIHVQIVQLFSLS